MSCCARAQGFSQVMGISWMDWLPGQKDRPVSPAPPVLVSAPDSQTCSSPRPLLTLPLFRFLPNHLTPSWLCFLSLCPSNCTTAVLVPWCPHSFLCPPVPLSSASSASLPLLSATECLSLVSSSVPRALLPVFPLSLHSPTKLTLKRSRFLVPASIGTTLTVFFFHTWAHLGAPGHGLGHPGDRAGTGTAAGPDLTETLGWALMAQGVRAWKGEAQRVWGRTGAYGVQVEVGFGTR